MKNRIGKIKKYLAILIMCALTLMFNACALEVEIPSHDNPDGNTTFSFGYDESISWEFGDDSYDSEDWEFEDVSEEEEYDYSLDLDDNSSDEINSDSEFEEEQNEFLSEEIRILAFRNDKLLKEHFEKHGIEMGFASAKEYEQAAAAVVNNPDALHKIEKEDGDDVYYLESTNEFVVVSTDGYIRTYFRPDKGIAYYEKQ